MRNLILIAVAALSLQSCATILGGSSRPVSFNTNDKAGMEITGAMIYVDGIEQGMTPAIVKVKPDAIIELRKDGFKTRQFVVGKKFNGVSIINLGSIIGWGVDLATGAINIPDQKIYKLQLEPMN